MSKRKFSLSAKKKNLQNHKHPKIGCNYHHPYPISRGERGDFGKFKEILISLKLTVRAEKHEHWHHLFENLLAEEVILFLKKANREGIGAAPEFILSVRRNCRLHRSMNCVSEKDLESWKEIFNGETDLRRVRKIVHRDWLYPGIYASVSDRGRVTRLTIILPKFIAKIISENIQVDSFKNGRILRLT